MRDSQLQETNRVREGRRVGAGVTGDGHEGRRGMSWALGVTYS